MQDNAILERHSSHRPRASFCRHMSSGVPGVREGIFRAGLGWRLYSGLQYGRKQCITAAHILQASRGAMDAVGDLACSKKMTNEAVV